MKTLIMIGVIIAIFNLTVLTIMAIRYLFPRCDWCHRRYYLRSSTSSFQNVFCSYRCNYWDMRDYIAANVGVNISEIDDYMARRGYPHPEVMETVR